MLYNLGLKYVVRPSYKVSELFINSKSSFVETNTSHLARQINDDMWSNKTMPRYNEWKW